jgi:hypothetical protein
MTSPDIASQTVTKALVWWHSKRQYSIEWDVEDEKTLKSHYVMGNCEQC